jgi:CheY-like chemotaxis protein
MRIDGFCTAVGGRFNWIAGYISYCSRVFRVIQCSGVPVKQDFPIEILLIEDNPGEARLTVEAMRDAKIPNRIHVVGDGDAALKFLNKADSYAAAPRPDLILLDLDLPKLDGRELLAQIKGDVRLKDIPVVVITSSKKPEDVISSYRNQVSSYIQKPVDIDDYFEAIRCLKELWFHVATLPRYSAYILGCLLHVAITASERVTHRSDS